MRDWLAPHCASAVFPSAWVTKSVVGSQTSRPSTAVNARTLFFPGDARAFAEFSKLHAATLFAPATNAFGLRRLVGRPQANGQIDGAHLDQIAIRQRDFRSDGSAPNERAVGAAQILERDAPLAAADANDRVAARDAGRIQPDVASRVASDDVVALRELAGLAVPRHPADEGVNRGA